MTLSALVLHCDRTNPPGSINPSTMLHIISPERMQLSQYVEWAWVAGSSVAPQEIEQFIQIST